MAPSANQASGAMSSQVRRSEPLPSMPVVPNGPGITTPAPSTRAFGLWPEVRHSAIGRVRAEGLPVHLSETDWKIERGGPCLGEHNEFVLGEILGLPSTEIDKLREEGVI